MKQLIRALSITLIVLISFCATAQKKGNAAKTINIPFDSTNNRYTYVRIVEVPGKTASELYKAGKEWCKTKYSDDKFLIDEDNTKFIDQGNFTINVVMNGGMVKVPFVYTVIYNLNVYTKDGKSKVEISNIRLTQNAQGTADEQTIEAFKAQTEGMSMGKKIAEGFVIDCFEAIDVQMKKVLEEIEAALKGNSPKKDDW